MRAGSGRSGRAHGRVGGAHSRTSSRPLAKCPAIRPSVDSGRATWSARSTRWTASWAGRPTPPASSSGCSIAPRGRRSSGPRAQSDRKLYRQAMQRPSRDSRGLTMLEGGVEDLLVEAAAAVGGHDARMAANQRRVRGSDHRHFPEGRHPYRAKADPGRSRRRSAGDRSSPRQSMALGLAMGRLKTGTPARLDGRTIDWARSRAGGRRSSPCRSRS